MKPSSVIYVELVARIEENKSAYRLLREEQGAVRKALE
jgi:hypothetical protein